MYPESCFQSLIGLKGTCNEQTAMYWLDDIPGIDVLRLAQVAEANSAPTGEKLGEKIIETASRFMAADVEAIYDAQYKVQNTLVTGCSTCNFLANYSNGSEKGILIKNNTDSAFAALVVDKLRVKINSTGTFTIVLDDGQAPKEIEYDFEAGTEYTFAGLNYSTKMKSVKVYFKEPEVLQSLLSCKRAGSGCGCSGAATVISDLHYTGLVAGVESQSAYSFIPCAFIRCDASDLLCFVANSAPRMIGMALLYKASELYFSTNFNSNRANKVAAFGTEDTKESAEYYRDLYDKKLNGKTTRGVKDLVFTTLQQTSDVCVVCNSLTGIAWATG